MNQYINLFLDNEVLQASVDTFYAPYNERHTLTIEGANHQPSINISATVEQLQNLANIVAAAVATLAPKVGFVSSGHHHKCGECGKTITTGCAIGLECPYDYLVTCATCAREQAQEVEFSYEQRLARLVDQDRLF